MRKTKTHGNSENNCKNVNHFAIKRKLGKSIGSKPLIRQTDKRRITSTVKIVASNSLTFSFILFLATNDIIDTTKIAKNAEMVRSLESSE